MVQNFPRLLVQLRDKIRLKGSVCGLGAALRARSRPRRGRGFPDPPGGTRPRCGRNPETVIAANRQWDPPQRRC